MENKTVAFRSRNKPHAHAWRLVIPSGQPPPVTVRVNGGCSHTFLGGWYHSLLMSAPQPGADEPRELPCSLTAYRLPRCVSYLKIVPASPSRAWMDVETGGWANRCLPLRIANQNGWTLLCDADFEAVWTGKPAKDSVRIKFDRGQASANVSSMFGYGVLTFGIPYLFRTPPGWNLWARGPANFPKDGIAPLEGIVETDWLNFPFTMNWKFTRTLKRVRFERDEPVCVLVPIRRGDAEQFLPETRNLESHQTMLRSFELGLAHRQEVRHDLLQEKNVEGRKLGHYVRGEGYLGERGEEHQKRLEIRAFSEIEAAPQWTAPETPRARRGLFARLFRR